MKARCAVSVAAIVVVGAAACSSREPAADESRVCGAVQRIVDDLAAGRSQDALATLSELEQAVGATSNDRLATAGGDFFENMYTDIDYTQLTIDETVELGQQYQQALAASLDAVVAECADVGARVEGLPKS